MTANMYDGSCRKCGLAVRAGEGILVDSKPYHVSCDPRLTGGSPSFSATDEVEAEIDPTELKDTVEELIAKISEGFLATVPAMVRDEVIKASRTVEIKVGVAPKVTLKQTHRMLPAVVRAVAADCHPFLVGPAGSGKTTLARQVAQTLKLKFYAENRVTSEFKLLGFVNAQGKYVRTQFRDAYEKGGVFLLDEVDASDPDALVALNSAIENGVCPFPDKLVEVHKDFKCIAAGNTFGRGADRQYVGRNQLDASTLDRFVIIYLDYDEDLEMELAGNAEWARRVQAIRKAAEAVKARIIVSPRASIYGARLLAAGEDQGAVEESVVWKGIDPALRIQITSRIGAAS